MNIKSLLIDIVGLSGFSAFCVGLFFSFGLPVMLMVAGGLMVIFALWAGN
ncbi:hypothetical protein [Vibrio sp. E150_018]